MLSINVHRFLLILVLLAAAFPAAASAQDPVPVTPPVATTGAASAITLTGATLSGTIDRNGGATTYHFEYGTSPAYGLNTTETPVPEEGTDPVAVNVPITGLTRDTAYNFRLVATNPAGISRGANRTFRTAPGPRAPAVSRTAARDITSRGARLTATVDPNALETTVRFEYGRTTSYGATTGRFNAGAGDRGVAVSIATGALRPYTRYHYRTVATNSAGTTRSLDRSFVTTREPTGISIALTPSRVIWSGSLSVIGRVAGTAVGGTRIALEKQDWPFSSGFSQVGDTPLGRQRRLLPLRPALDLRDLAVPRRDALGPGALERDPDRLERGQGRGARAGRRAASAPACSARSGRACPTAAPRSRSARPRASGSSSAGAP